MIQGSLPGRSGTGFWQTEFVTSTTCRLLARSAGFYATRLETCPNPTSTRAPSRAPRRPGSPTTTYTRIPTPTPCLLLELKWAALLEYRWRLDIWAYRGPGLLRTPSATSSAYGRSWIPQVRKNNPNLGQRVSALNTKREKSGAGCYCAWWMAREPVLAAGRTIIQHCVSPFSYKSTLNGPFHGMMRLQTLCSPVISPLIPQLLQSSVAAPPDHHSMFPNSVALPGEEFFCLFLFMREQNFSSVQIFKIVKVLDCCSIVIIIIVLIFECVVSVTCA